MTTKKRAKKDNFENDLREILIYAFQYGVKTTGVVSPKDGIRKYKKFIAACHEGYGLAQEKIVENIIAFEAEIKGLKTKLKKARFERKKQEIGNIIQTIGLLEYRINVLKKVADSLGWLFAKFEGWIIRRHYLGHKKGYLIDSNISSTREVVKTINNDKLCFALICDITTCFQLCDLIKIDANDIKAPQISYIELKEGIVNKKVLDMLKNYSVTKCDRALYLFGKVEGKKALDQLFRVVNQEYRMSQAKKIIKTGKGKDSFTGKEINIKDKYYSEEDYFDVLPGLFEICKNEGNGIACIDGCLYIGVFSKEKSSFANLEFQHAIYHFLNPDKKCQFEEGENPEEEIKEINAPKYQISDLRNGFGIPLAMPLYLWPIDRDIMMDIIFGRWVVYTYLDFDKFFNLASSLGFEIGWGKIKPGIVDYFTRMGKRPYINKEGITLEMGDLSLGKMKYDGIKPSSILKLWAESIHDQKKGKRKSKVGQ
jgi:hypothetical protein